MPRVIGSKKRSENIIEKERERKGGYKRHMRCKKKWELIVYEKEKYIYVCAIVCVFVCNNFYSECKQSLRFIVCKFANVLGT